MQGYTLLDVLGRGTVGTVHRAEDRQHPGRIVALKRVQGGRVARTAIEGEVAALARLAHPSIVRVLDVVEDSDGAALVTPFLPGGSLADRIAARGPLPPSEVADLGARVGDALAAAHDAGVIHRDLKPANILYDAEEQPLLADFGAALLDRGSDGWIVGSATYLDPAVAVDGAAPDTRSDQYGLAVTLYEALAGVPPFAAPTVEATLRVADRGVHVPLADHAPHAPAALCEAIERSLSRAPEDRFTTARELAGRLAEVHTQLALGDDRRAPIWRAGDHASGPPPPPPATGATTDPPHRGDAQPSEPIAQAGAATGTAPGQPTGPAPGQPADPAPGQPTGPAPGQPTGPDVGPDLGHHAGRGADRDPGRPGGGPDAPSPGGVPSRWDPESATAGTGPGPGSDGATGPGAGPPTSPQATTRFGPAPPTRRTPAPQDPPAGQRRPWLIVAAVLVVLVPLAIVTALVWGPERGSDVGGDQPRPIADPDGSTVTDDGRPQLPRCDDAPPPPDDGEVREADLEGAGCTVPVTWDAGDQVLAIPTTEGASRFRLGRPGDQLLLGAWECDGRDAPALYRPDTGQVFTFGRFGEPGAELESRPAQDSGVRDGTARVVRDDDGCDTVEVDEG